MNFGQWCFCSATCPSSNLEHGECRGTCIKILEQCCFFFCSVYCYTYYIPLYFTSSGNLIKPWSWVVMVSNVHWSICTNLWVSFLFFPSWNWQVPLTSLFLSAFGYSSGGWTQYFILIAAWRFELWLLFCSVLMVRYLRLILHLPWNVFELQA